MIIGLAENGDILIKCDKCGYSARVDYELHDSPFWDIFVGQELLRALAHILAVHKGDGKEARNGTMDV